ncbi:uncharacterized protein B0T15DRAFT_576758 [Chaetomium strumarium]|uniref:Uncharacterized protein n=1 Tax=Chaetomium strumarium TaxID=1170767 RepID=A0AAJ0GNX5_9PEZI|nr:hypothetical protein B0T15DRAFT_576758 [Chaetomium strumarium]
MGPATVFCGGWLWTLGQPGLKRFKMIDSPWFEAAVDYVSALHTTWLALYILVLYYDRRSQFRILDGGGGKGSDHGAATEEPFANANCYLLAGRSRRAFWLVPSHTPIM